MTRIKIDNNTPLEKVLHDLEVQLNNCEKNEKTEKPRAHFRVEGHIEGDKDEYYFVVDEVRREATQ